MHQFAMRSAPSIQGIVRYSVAEHVDGEEEEDDAPYLGCAGPEKSVAQIWAAPRSSWRPK